MLLGFVATSFIITITLSAADATAHIVENPFVDRTTQVPPSQVIVTIVLIGLLGAVFLKGFSEAIGIAVGIVAIFIALNIVHYRQSGLYDIFWVQPEVFVNWQALVWSDPIVGGSFFG